MLYDAGSSNLVLLCDNLEGWDGWKVGGRLTREEIYVFLWLIHVGQKLMQYCKAIILQLKILKRNLKKNSELDLYSSRGNGEK